tara:strand:+ start:1173 stop:2159 length:987 start_codon:yes stop_codon:yes gene_type:complete
MAYSVGKGIRLMKNNSDRLFLLSGDDYFLQTFFISKLSEYNNNNYKTTYLNLEEDSDIKVLLNEMCSTSLFPSKNLFIVRNFSKISNKDKNEITLYLNKPKNDLIIVFIYEDYYAKNSFLNILSNKTQHIDTRTPFPNKIKEWIKYYVAYNKINIDDSLLDDIIYSNNDEISSITNEIDKLFLIHNCSKITDDPNNLILKNNKNIRPWHLLDSLGKKNIELSIKNMESLLSIGYSAVPLIINLYNLFINLLQVISGNSNNIYGLNKIIINNINRYLKNYSEEEIKEILIDLKNMDVLIKTTNLNDKNLLSILMVKICQGYYGKSVINR